MRLDRKFIRIPLREAIDLLPKFTVASYNILAQTLIRRSSYEYASSSALKWAFRKKNLVDEIKEADADILCLQECDFYAEWFKPRLSELGYESEYIVKKAKLNGCAIFFKKDKFTKVAYEEVLFDEMAEDKTGVEREELCRGNVGQILALNVTQQREDSSAPLGVVIANAHLFWNPMYNFTRVRQVNHMLQRMQAFNKELNYPMVWAGDFNAVPSNITYRFATNQRFDIDTTDFTSMDMTRLMTPKEHADPLIGHLNSFAPFTPEALSKPITNNNNNICNNNNNNNFSNNNGSDNSTASPSITATETVASVPESASAAASAAAAHPDSDSSTIITANSAFVTPFTTMLSFTADEIEKRMTEARDLIENAKERLPICESVYSVYTDVHSVLPMHPRWTGEPAYTTFCPTFKAPLDYIMLVKPNPNNGEEGVSNRLQLVPLELLEIPSDERLSRQVAIPNDELSSDHLMIMCRFGFQNKDADTN